MLFPLFLTLLWATWRNREAMSGCFFFCLAFNTSSRRSWLTWTRHPSPAPGLRVSWKIKDVMKGPHTCCSQTLCMGVPQGCLLNHFPCSNCKNMIATPLSLKHHVSLPMSFQWVSEKPLPEHQQDQGDGGEREEEESRPQSSVKLKLRYFYTLISDRVWLLNPWEM